VRLDDPIGKHPANLHETLMKLATPVQIKSMAAYLETWQPQPTSIDSSSDDPAHFESAGTRDLDSKE
jgi:hypothetical protein